MALLLTLLSVSRSHWADFGRSPFEVLREKDKQLLILAQKNKNGQPVQLNYDDVTFADFPVDVINNNSMFVLELNE